MKPEEVPPRAATKIEKYALAMQHEMVDNAHKGDWLVDGEAAKPERERVDPELMTDLIYHALKLNMAMAAGDKQAVLEYAADVGNCAWFIADKHEVLDDPEQYFHEGAIEYDKERRSMVSPAALAREKGIAHTFVIGAWGRAWNAVASQRAEYEVKWTVGGT